MERLSQKTINNNSGQDLYDYFFNGIKLKYVYADDKREVGNHADWEEDGLDWLHEELLDGEEFDFFDGDNKFIYTSFYRVANIKKKLWRRTQYQGQMVTVVLNFTGISVHRFVKKRWGIEMDYDSLPQIVKDGLNSATYFNKLKNKKEQNAKKAR